MGGRYRAHTIGKFVAGDAGSNPTHGHKYDSKEWFGDPRTCGGATLLGLYICCISIPDYDLEISRPNLLKQTSCSSSKQYQAPARNPSIQS